MPDFLLTEEEIKDINRQILEDPEWNRLIQIEHIENDDDGYTPSYFYARRKLLQAQLDALPKPENLREGIAKEYCRICNEISEDECETSISGQPCFWKDNTELLIPLISLHSASQIEAARKEEREKLSTELEDILNCAEGDYYSRIQQLRRKIQ